MVLIATGVLEWVVNLYVAKRFEGGIAKIGRAGVLHTQGYGFKSHFLHRRWFVLLIKKFYLL